MNSNLIYISFRTLGEIEFTSLNKHIEQAIEWEYLEKHQKKLMQRFFAGEKWSINEDNKNIIKDTIIIKFEKYDLTELLADVIFAFKTLFSERLILQIVVGTKLDNVREINKCGIFVEKMACKSMRYHNFILLDNLDDYFYVWGNKKIEKKVNKKMSDVPVEDNTWNKDLKRFEIVMDRIKEIVNGKDENKYIEIIKEFYEVYNKNIIKTSCWRGWWRCVSSLRWRM